MSSIPMSPLFSQPLKTSFLSLLQTAKRPYFQILQIHAQMILTGIFSNTFASSRLVAAISASNPSDAVYADAVFSQIPHPNTFIYNTMIRIHADSPCPLRALIFYRQLKGDGVPVDNYTYPFVLRACGLVLGLREGRGVHGEVVKRGFGGDLFVGNGLISMYCRCGEVGFGRKVFDGMAVRDLVSWNAMAGGYVGCGEMREAQKVFDEMPERDVFSWAMMIDGYGKKLGDVGRARELFDEMPDRDTVCWNSMIDGYASVGEMNAAQSLFEEMTERNVVSWSIMIEGYARHGKSKEALDLFQQMLYQGTKPDKVSAVGAIMACAQLGALDQGRWIHKYLEKNKISLDVVAQTALIDMYMKCGSLDHARRLFENMPERNVISSNVMIVGLGNNGFGEEALELFCQMERAGAPMDDLTFLGALTACSHAGLVSEGLRIFDRMRNAYKIQPKVEHYGCFVDLLGRAGRLDEAKNIIETMPTKPNSALWGSLLAACRTHRCVDLAEISVDRLVELGADDGGVYVLMSNIYAEEGMWDDVLRIRKLVTSRGMKKEIGRSVIEVGGSVNEFVNGDRLHFRMEEIYSVLWSLSKSLMSAI
ncbi:pentatricopeptide repeat-containing protein At3g29230-like [Magnolia sinica]|uniref:pentatricopeptide repeat-containing protein At3g29230-like n=1 Tax=Magnolia sinica TaxID=86752 RepID=UPI002658F92E|nr:pentatricopeptide repeat-containing protein At3g29230-like [Magnolia sinica]